MKFANITMLVLSDFIDFITEIATKWIMYIMKKMGDLYPWKDGMDW